MKNFLINRFTLHFFFILIHIPFFINPAFSSEKSEEPIPYILSALDSHDVVILGEIHRHKESEELAYRIIESRIKAGKPLTVALEIDSDQNYLIENGNIDKIKLIHELNFLEYRNFLSKLSKLQSSTDLLEVKAIDLALNKPGKRDPWMADQVMSLLEQNCKPIFILIGNFHAIKHVVWNHNIDDPFLGEILVLKGIDTFVVMQDWKDDSCNGEKQSNLYFTDSQEVMKSIDKLLSCMNVMTNEMPPEKVVDAVIQWKCKQ